MILTKKHIAVFAAAVIAVTAVTAGIKKYSASQTFSQANVKIVLDAGHGALV